MGLAWFWHLEEIDETNGAALMAQQQTSNVIRLYDVRPELALEHLKRSTGLDFDAVPQSLATFVLQAEEPEEPPVLTEVVDAPVVRKAR